MKNLDYFTTFTRSRRVFFTRYGAKATNPVDGAKPANPVDGAKSAKSVCCDKPANSFKLLTSITLQKIGPISTDFVDAEKASFFNTKELRNGTKPSKATIGSRLSGNRPWRFPDLGKGVCLRRPRLFSSKKISIKLSQQPRRYLGTTSAILINDKFRTKTLLRACRQISHVQEIHLQPQSYSGCKNGDSKCLTLVICFFLPPWFEISWNPCTLFHFQ